MTTPAEIFSKASEHDGRYLLPRKYTDKPDPQRDACETLVESKHAVWLPWWSDYSPGIALTGRPLES